MKTETKGERIARQRAAYAVAKAADPTLTEGAFASVFGAQERAKAEAAQAAMPAAPAAAKPAPVAAPAPRRVDRVWAGGDRDSDDISYTR